MCSDRTLPQPGKSGYTPPLEDALANPSRLLHRWEMPLVWLSAIITFFVIGVALLAVMGVLPQELDQFLSSQGGFDVRAVIAFAIVAPFLFYVMRYYLGAGVRANSIKVGPKQFPEIHERYLAVAQRIGIRNLPSLYVVNGNGVVNAYAFSCNRRHGYVVLHAEIAQMIHRAPQIVDFVMAHELAHHKLNHVSLWRMLMGVIPGLMYLPGLATTRAQEYSADRMAYCACPPSVDSASILAVGPSMAVDVNAAAWLEQCHADDRSWLIRLHNIISRHAVLTKRYKALKDLEAEGLSRHGQMF